MKLFDSRRDEAGAVMLEACITFLLFLLTCILFIEMARMSFYSISGQYLATRALRYANLGGENAQPNQCASVRNAQFLNFILNAGESTNNPQQKTPYGVPLTEELICVSPITEDCVPGNINLGAPGEFIQVNLALDYDMVALGFPIQIRPGAIGKNEPFPAANPC